MAKAGRRRVLRRTLAAWVAAFGALVISAPSVLAGTMVERFEFGGNRTWTVPEGVTSIEVKVAGGGGGGVNVDGISGGNGALVQAQVQVQGGQTLNVGVGGGGNGLSGQPSGGAGGGGASIVEGFDVLIIAGGGGGAGLGGNSANSGSGGSAGANTTNGDGGNAPAVSSINGGLGGGGGTRGGSGCSGPDTHCGRDYVIGSGSSTNGNGGINRHDSTTAATVGGPGGGVSKIGRGGNGGAGYGGGGMGNGGTLGSVSASSGGGAGGSTAQGAAVSMIDGESSFYSSAGGAGGVAAGGANGWVTITWVIPPRPVVRNGRASRVVGPPIIVNFAMPAGLSCTAPRLDRTGSWIQVPSEGDCAITPDARSIPEVGLLGWATTPGFPTDIAQRQVDNGWGAYEEFDTSGNLAAVFIPAGGWTQASSDTNLFPIWATN